MPERTFLTPLTPGACRARLNEHLAMPFLALFSESGIDGRTDATGFIIWPVLMRGKDRVMQLHGRYTAWPRGTRITAEFGRPSLGWKVLFEPGPGPAEQESLLIDFLARTIEAVEVTSEPE
jgi:hypothetical protein